MYITGSGVIAPFEFRTDQRFKPDTNLALEWFMTADGNWHAVDWDSNSDFYNAKIETFGTETYINNIRTQLENNRLTGEFITMSGWASDEKIFGEDITYTDTFSGVVTDIDVRKSNSFKGFSLEIEIRAMSPGTESLPSFDWSNVSCIEYEYTSDRKFDLIQYDSYDSNIFMYDHEADEGILEIKLNMTNSELAKLRQYNRTQRGSSFTLPAGGLNGIANPFGPISSTGPHTVKLLQVKEQQRISPFRWLVSVLLSEVI